MCGCAEVAGPGAQRSAVPEPGRPGFVLMEAVVALAILSIFGIAVLAALAGQLRTADRANHLLEARFLAEDRLTALRMLDYDRLARLPDSLGAGVFPPPFDGYAWTATSEPVPDEFDLFSVEVVVSGHGVSYPLRTFIYRRAPGPVAQSAPQGGP